MRKIKTQLPDGDAVITLKPGIKEPDTANMLIYSATRQIHGKRAFVSGPGSIPSALWAARSGALITTWTDNVNFAVCINETFQSANMTEPTVHLQAGYDNIALNSFDCALIHLPRGKALQLEILQLAAAVLKEGGRLVFVGAKREGVKGALKYAKEIFHFAGIVAQKGGYHVGLSQKPPGHSPLPQLSFSQNELMIKGEATSLISYPGVFAAGRMDAGAQALIYSMTFQVGASVLDMGCGTGLVGLSAIRKGAIVTFTDVSARAVESTRKTLSANNLEGTVLLTSGAERCDPGVFDVIYSNPPFHKGHGVDYETTRYLLDQAVRVLRNKGTLYLVANTFLKYGSWIRDKFTNVGVHYENKQYRVWKATK